MGGGVQPFSSHLFQNTTEYLITSNKFSIFHQVYGSEIKFNNHGVLQESDKNAYNGTIN